MQGFPDYFTFVGLGKDKNTSWVRHNSLVMRYQQLGNAVSPLVADALGRCLAQAAVGKAPVGAFVISTPCPELDRVRHCLLMPRLGKAGCMSERVVRSAPP